MRSRASTEALLSEIASQVAGNEGLDGEPARNRERQIIDAADQVLGSARGALAGRITDEAGRPIAEAAVSVYYREIEDDGAEQLAGWGIDLRGFAGIWPPTKTGALGLFRYDALLPGVLQVVVDAHELGYRESEVRVTVPRTGEEQLELRLQRGGTIRGRLVDERGFPVADAWVNAQGADEQGFDGQRVRSRQAYPDGSGAYQVLGLPPGRFRLEAEGRGRIAPPPREIDVAAAATITGIDFVLPGGGSLSGRVTSAAGEPVRAVLAACCGGDMVGSSACGVDGSYEIASLPECEVRVFIRSDDFAWAGVQDVRIRGGSQRRLDVVLGPSSVLRGSVQSETGTAVPEARLTVRSKDPALPPSLLPMLIRVESREGGEFEVTCFAGAFEILASADGYLSSEPAHVSPRAGEVVEGLRLALRRPAALSGLVSGAPGGAEVVVVAVAGRGRQEAVRTDPDGSFRIEDIRATELELFARTKDFGLLDHAHVDLGANPESQSVKLALRPGATIEGRVRLPDGRPAAGIDVTAVFRPPFVQRTAETTADGRYVLSRMYAGVYVVSVPHGDVREVTVQASEAVGGIDLVVPLPKEGARDGPSETR